MMKEAKFFRKQADKAERWRDSLPTSKSRNDTKIWRRPIAVRLKF